MSTTTRVSSRRELIKAGAAALGLPLAANGASDVLPLPGAEIAPTVAPIQIRLSDIRADHGMRCLHILAEGLGGTLREWLMTDGQDHSRLATQIERAFAAFGPASGLIDVGEAMVHGFSIERWQQSEATKAANRVECERKEAEQKRISEETAAAKRAELLSSDWQPSDEDVEEWALRYSNEQTEAALHLQNARMVYDTHPDLVTCEEFPAHILPFLVAGAENNWGETDYEADSEILIDEDLEWTISDETREKARATLIERHRKGL